MLYEAQKDTDVVNPMVGADTDSVNAAKQMKKEHARLEREARKEAKRVEREAEKAEMQAAKAKAKAELDALKAAKKEKKERLKSEKEDAKRAAADQQLREAEALKIDVDSAAVEIRTGDENIRKYGRMSTIEAEKVGLRILDIKPKLKLLKPKIGLKVWIETICGILYRCANNYVCVAKAIAKDPSLREMGLTDVYEVLRLVTRKRKTVIDGQQPDGNSGDDAAGDEDDDTAGDEVIDDDGVDESGDGAGVADEAGDQDAADSNDTVDPNSSKPNTRKPSKTVGPLTARWFGGSYTIDVGGADWRKKLHAAIDDPSFGSILQGTGTLIRLTDDNAGAAN